MSGIQFECDMIIRVEIPIRKMGAQDQNSNHQHQTKLLQYAHKIHIIGEKRRKKYNKKKPHDCKQKHHSKINVEGMVSDIHQVLDAMRQIQILKLRWLGRTAPIPTTWNYFAFEQRTQDKTYSFRLQMESTKSVFWKMSNIHKMCTKMSQLNGAVGWKINIVGSLWRCDELAAIQNHLRYNHFNYLWIARTCKLCWTYYSIKYYTFRTDLSRKLSL